MKLQVINIDGKKTENTRVSYPLEHIENSVFASGKPSMGSHPKTIVFLTCDAAADSFNSDYAVLNNSDSVHLILVVKDRAAQ